MGNHQRASNRHTGTAKNIEEKENITAQEEVGGGKGQNQDGRIFTFYFTYVFSSVICFPLGREQERFCT